MNAFIIKGLRGETVGKKGLEEGAGTLPSNSNHFVPTSKIQIHKYTNTQIHKKMEKKKCQESTFSLFGRPDLLGFQGTPN